MSADHPGEDTPVHTADDGYCTAICPYGFPAPPCDLQVVRPGKFQCWCDHSCDGTGYLHDEGICEGDHRLAAEIGSNEQVSP